MRKGNILLVVLAVTVVAAASIGGYFWQQKSTLETQSSGPNYPKQATNLEPTKTVPSSGETLTIDFSVCQAGRKRVDAAFGSTTYEIIGKKANACEINYGGEVENPNWDGKLNTNCLVPTSLGKIAFGTTQYGVDFLPIKNYCLTK